MTHGHGKNWVGDTWMTEIWEYKILIKLIYSLEKWSITSFSQILFKLE